MCKDYKKLQFSKKKLKFSTVSKWRPNNTIFISRHFDVGQNLKKHFPKGIFNEIWLKVGEHKYIYFTENNCLILCNNANLC